MAIWCRHANMLALGFWPFCAASAQQLGQGTNAADLTVWRAIAALVFIGILVAAAWLIVRNRGGKLHFLQKAGDRRVKLLEVTRISPQSQLCLIEYGDKEYLLAVTAQGASIIESRPSPQATPEAM